MHVFSFRSWRLFPFYCYTFSFMCSMNSVIELISPAGIHLL